MGTLETRVKKQERYGKIERAVLGTLAGISVLSIAVIAPNALKILDLLPKDLTRSRTQNIKKATARLKEKGLIEFELTKRGTFARITPKGERILAQIRGLQQTPSRKRKWDKKWRIVIFDIKEERRNVRDRLRQTLTNIGFLKLQNSVWIYPYDCEELIVLLKADFKIGKDVLYVIANVIEYDRPVREHFRLR